MTGYTGARCPVCNKKFVDEDDIVVCPICGAPHHRECYALENECAFEKEHISGKPWKPPVEENKPPEGNFCINPQNGETWTGDETQAKTCGFCGAKNPKDNLFCCSCGHRLLPGEAGTTQGQPPFPNAFGDFFHIDPAAAIYGGVIPTEQIGDHTAKDVATFVGKSSNYYIPRFHATSKKEGKYHFDFSFSAFFLGFIYFFYRKMYKVGVALLALMVALAIPSFMMAQEIMPAYMEKLNDSETIGFTQEDIDDIYEQSDHEKVETYNRLSRITSAINMVMRFVVGLFANYLYYKHTMKQMAKVKEQHSAGTATEYDHALREAGGVKMSAVVLALLAVFVIAMVISSIIVYNVMPVLG